MIKELHYVNLLPIAVCSALLVCVPAIGIPSILDEPPAPSRATDTHRQMLTDFVACVNKADRKALTQFASDNLTADALHGMSPEQIAEQIAQTRRFLGAALELCQIEKETSEELTALVKTRSEFPFYLRLHWRFDASQAGKITRIGIRPAAMSNPVTSRCPPDQLARDIDGKLTRMAAEDRFSGAIMIARDGKPLFQKAYGYADRDARILNTTETRFRLGSMNKMMTSVAIAQLVQAGKLKYTDTIGTILPDYPNKTVAEKVTLHHLLTHTSGLGDFFGPEFDKQKNSLHEIKDYLKLFVEEPLHFTPGESWEYSNAGFIVLGLIIEKVSGQTYYDYVQKHIYDVAGMKQSGSYPKEYKIPHLAVGYLIKDDGGTLAPNVETLPYRGMSAGGGDSNLGDLLRFDQALRQHKLLSEASTKVIWTGKSDPEPGSGRRYAYGFEEATVAGHHIVGHSGGAPGMNADLDIYLDNGYTVIVLSNQDPPVVQPIVDYIRRCLP